MNYDDLLWKCQGVLDSKDYMRLAGLIAAEKELRASVEKAVIEHNRDLIEYGVSTAMVEQEACALICDEVQATGRALWDLTDSEFDHGYAVGAEHCANAIRSRHE